MSESNFKNLQYHFMPKDQGQIVVQSYAIDNEYLYRHTIDQSDKTESWERAAYYDDVEFEPQNNQLPDHDEWEMFGNWKIEVNDDAGSNESLNFDDRPNEEEIESAIEEWVEGGDWGTDGASVSCRWTLHDGWGSEVDSGWHTVDIAAEEPMCEKGKDHEWERPHDIVGGLEENPGVHGHGGGVIIHEVCSRCGLHRHTDTWADDGRGGVCETVTYSTGEEK